MLFVASAINEGPVMFLRLTPILPGLSLADAEVCSDELRTWAVTPGGTPLNF